MDVATTKSRLQCPCGSAIDDPSETCGTCGYTVGTRHGVPVFVEDAPPGFLGLMQERFESPEGFLAAVDDDGWRSALASLQRPGDPDRLQQASAPNRVSWLSLFDTSDWTAVLDVGSGTGGVACQMPPECRVVAVDRSSIDAAFVQRRAEQQGIEDFLSLVADACQLPLTDEQFDLVTILGVLEWIPAGRTSPGPRECQLQALAEALRVLRPGGHVFLGIENRFHAGYFLGVPEPHAQLKYVSLMERDAADVFSNEVRGTDFREWTHSLGELVALVEEAGFTDVQPYSLYPNYRLTTCAVPLQPAIVEWWARESLNPTRCVDRIDSQIYALVRYLPGDASSQLVRDFGIVAKRPEVHR